MPGVRSGNLYIGEDNLVEWGDPDIPGSGLYDRNAGVFVNNATMLFTLKNSAESAVSGATAVSMDYVPGTHGCYRGVLEDGVSLTENATYHLEVTATASGDRVGFRRIEYVAKYHGSD